MGDFKKIVRSRVVQGFVSWLIAQYIRLIWLTCRWSTVGAEHPEKLWCEGTAGIVAFWHGRLMMMPYAWKKGVPFNMLSSSHPDGRVIAYAVRAFGISNIFGSSSKGGTAALRAILAALKIPETVGITPEGARGPRMRVGAGVISIARLSGVPILPLTYSMRRRKILTSWDRFLFPLPFSEGIFIWGEPLVVPRNADAATQEALRRALEERMNALTAEADRRMGHAPVEPEPEVETP